MEAKASARYIRVTPMKARRVVNLIRGQQANEALAILKFAPQGASEPVFKVLQSAVANARQLADRDGLAFKEDELVVSEAFVDEGPTLKRFRPRAQGRAYRIRKRTSHITVVVQAEPERLAPPAPAKKAAAKKAAPQKAAPKTEKTEQKAGAR